MKILHIIFSFLTGGAETMLVDIVNEQTRRGHDVELLIVNSGIDEGILSHVSPQVKLTRFNRKEGSMPLLLMGRLNTYIIRHNPDIVHLHTNKLTGLVKVRPRTTLYTVHALNIPMKYSAGSNMAAISEAVREDVLARVKNARIRTIANGINMANIATRPKGLSPHKSFRIVQVGRLFADTKGQDILIDACAILAKRGYDVNVTFIGEGDDLEKLRAQAEKAGIGEKVFFAGNKSRKDVYSSLKDYDMMCHQSRHEGFGLVIAEGMAAGLPVAVPKGGGPWEVADKGRLGETFEGGNASSCADAISRIIDNYPAALEKAEEGIAYVDSHYSVNRMVSEYDSYYMDLLSGKR